MRRTIASHLDLAQLEQYHFPEGILAFIGDNASTVESLRAVHAACKDETGWALQTESEAIRISYRKEPAALFHSIKADFVAESSVLDFVATLNEFDLLGELVKLLKVETRMLKRFGPSRKVVYMRTALYWPLSDMDFVMSVRGCDALEELDAVVIWAWSPKGDRMEGVEIPSAKQCGTMRVDIVKLECVCQPLSPQRSRVVMVYNVDFRIALPQKLINWILRTLSFTFVRVLKAQCESLEGSKHEARMQEKPIYRKWRLGCAESRRRRSERQHRVQESDI